MVAFPDIIHLQNYGSGGHKSFIAKKEMEKYITSIYKQISIFILAQMGNDMIIGRESSLKN